MQFAGRQLEDSAAVVACKQLQVSDPWAPQKPARWLGGGYFGAGTGPIHLSRTSCSGYEVALGYCYNNWGALDAGISHADDAGLLCNAPPVRLRWVGPPRGLLRRVAALCL